MQIEPPINHKILMPVKLCASVPLHLNHGDLLIHFLVILIDHLGDAGHGDGHHEHEDGSGEEGAENVEHGLYSGLCVFSL